MENRSICIRMVKIVPDCFGIYIYVKSFNRGWTLGLEMVFVLSNNCSFWRIFNRNFWNCLIETFMLVMCTQFSLNSRWVGRGWWLGTAVLNILNNEVKIDHTESKTEALIFYFLQMPQTCFDPFNHHFVIQRILRN